MLSSTYLSLAWWPGSSEQIVLNCLPSFECSSFPGITSEVFPYLLRDLGHRPKLTKPIPQLEKWK